MSGVHPATQGTNTWKYIQTDAQMRPIIKWIQNVQLLVKDAKHSLLFVTVFLSKLPFNNSCVSWLYSVTVGICQNPVPFATGGAGLSWEAIVAPSKANRNIFSDTTC